MKPRHVPALALALSISACLGDFDIEFEDECVTDEGCPKDTVCRSGLLANHCEPGVCSNDLDCPAAEQCRIRQDVDPGQTRKTCERRLCTCDTNCPMGYLCDDSGWFNDAYCRAVTDERFCNTNTDCFANEECQPHGLCETNQKLCAPLACVCDDDCPAGQVCPQSPYGFACQEAPVCTADADCTGAETCTAHDSSHDMVPCASEHTRSSCTPK